MKGLVAATAVLGVLAIGGIPALALTLADNETGSASTPQEARQEGAERQPGPPPWANGQGKGHHKDDKGKDDKGKDEKKESDRDGGGKGQPGWSRHGDQVPPGWARNHEGRSPHGWAMREWAHCLADAAAALGDGERLDPEAACGERPAPQREKRR